jgi:hypothetical protein
VIISLYVDDILIFGTGIDVINEVKPFLSRALIWWRQVCPWHLPTPPGHSCSRPRGGRDSARGGRRKVQIDRSHC